MAEVDGTEVVVVYCSRRVALESVPFGIYDAEEYGDLTVQANRAPYRENTSDD